MSWLYKIQNNVSRIPEAVDYYEQEYQEIKKELNFSIGTLEKNATRLPSVMEHAYTHLQHIESILEYLNIQLKKVRSDTFKKYLENYQRALKASDASKYVDGDDDVVSWSQIVNEFAFVRNKFLSLTKGLEQKGWMISHVTKLRCAGLEDIHIDD